MQELKYLRDFAKGISRGEVSEAQLRQRMNQYAEGIYNAFWRGKQQRIEQQIEQQPRLRLEMMRELDPQAEHCNDCLGYAARGWVTADALPLPGEDSVCGNRCRCKVKWRIRNIMTGEIIA